MQPVINHLPFKSHEPRPEFQDEASGIANLEKTAKLKLLAAVVSLAIVIGAAASVLVVGFAILKFIATHIHGTPSNWIFTINF